MPIPKIGAHDAIARAEFDDLLRDWYSQTSEDQIGEAEFGQTAWVHVQEGTSVYRLNADTKRDGVADYVQLLDQHGDGLEWTIVANQHGRENKVAFGPDLRRVPHFYLYLCGDR